MSLMLLGDSNVERVWLNVRNNRELLRGAVFAPVKRFDQLQAGFQALVPSVSIHFFVYRVSPDLNFYFHSRLQF